MSVSSNNHSFPAWREQLSALTSRGQLFVTVERTAAELQVSHTIAAKRLARWAEQGWLRRVKRGTYIPVPALASNPRAWTEDPLVVADELFAPCYFTGWTSANHWSLTEQVFRTTIVKTARRVRAQRQLLLDGEYLVRHTDASSLEWGLRPVWINDRRVQFADPTRTVVDILDAPVLAGGISLVAEILDEYLSRQEPGMLIDYGDRLGNGAVFKRLGYLIEALSPKQTELIAQCRERVSAGFSYLNPGKPDRSKRDNRWNLWVNAAPIGTEAL